MPHHPETGLPALSDQDKARKLLDGNFVNIGKKVIAGNTLSAGEVKLLEQIAHRPAASIGGEKPGEPAFAKNKSQLADILGISRKTVQRYSTRDDAPKPRPNGSLCVAEWRAFLANNEVLGSEDLDAAALKAQQILLQNKRLSNKLAIERKEWIPKVVARQVLTELVTEAKSLSFNSVIRIVTVAKVAPDTTSAAEAVRTELERIWKTLEANEWHKPASPTSPQTNPQS